MKITAHTLVKNEQNWIWFSLMSVIDYVDELLVWDDSSTDSTPQIIKAINSSKIKYRQTQTGSARNHTLIRQQMLEATDSDWILILDGDEVWWWNSIKSLISAINSQPDKAAVVSPFINALGDIFHYQDPRFNCYQIHGFSGTIRAMNRKLRQLRIVNPHGRQEYQTQGTALQHLPPHRLQFVNTPFFHLTHLRRSPHDQTTLKRGFKYRFELGQPASRFPPEVFFLPRPKFVRSPWQHRPLTYEAISIGITPIRMVKQMFIPSQQGY